MFKTVKNGIAFGTKIFNKIVFHRSQCYCLHVQSTWCHDVICSLQAAPETNYEIHSKTSSGFAESTQQA